MTDSIVPPCPWLCRNGAVLGAGLKANVISASTGVRRDSPAVPCVLRCAAHPGRGAQGNGKLWSWAGHGSSSASLAGHSVVSLRDTEIIRDII